REKRMNVVLVYSGGLDSTVLLYHLQAEGHEVKALSIDYGQRHRRELQAAAEVARERGVGHRVVDLSAVAALFPDLALTSSAAEVPRAAYDAATMQATTVPNRNMVLVAVALAWAA